MMDFVKKKTVKNSNHENNICSGCHHSPAPGGDRKDFFNPEASWRVQRRMGVSGGKDWAYPAFHLSMHCFLCELAEEASHLELREHEAARWLTRRDMDSVGWLPADQGVADKLKVDDAVWG